MMNKSLALVVLAACGWVNAQDQTNTDQTVDTTQQQDPAADTPDPNAVPSGDDQTPADQNTDQTQVDNGTDAADPNVPAPEDVQPIVDALSGAGLTGLADAVSANPQVLAPIIGKTGWTVFAPTNDALTAAGAGTLAPEVLEAVLQYHISVESIDVDDITEKQVWETTYTSQGLEDGGQVVFVGPLDIDDDDDDDQDDQQDQDNVDDDVDAYVSYGMEQIPITQTVELDTNRVHVIPSVLLPPKSPAETLQAITESPVSEFYNLLQNPDYAPVATALEEQTNITIFVPNNEALQQFLADNADASVDDVTEILQYHVAVGVVYSTNIEATDYETLQGKTVTVNLDDGVKVNDANVVRPDYLTSNGVIHVIDGVLNPAQGKEPEDEDLEVTIGEGVSNGMSVMSFAALVGGAMLL